MMMASERGIVSHDVFSALARLILTLDYLQP